MPLTSCDSRLASDAGLTDVHSGKLIWSEVYDSPDADMRQVETTVSRAVARQIGRHLAPQ